MKTKANPETTIQQLNLRKRQKGEWKEYLHKHTYIEFLSKISLLKLIFTKPFK